MGNFTLGIALTLLFGPLVFLFLSRGFNKGLVVKNYPVNFVGRLGDTIFLPLYNGLIFSLGYLDILLMSKSNLFSSIIIALLFSGVYIVYKTKNLDKNNWASFKGANNKIPAYYHLAFVFVQSFLITSSLFYFSDSIFLWTLLGVYILIVIFSNRRFFIKTESPTMI